MAGSILGDLSLKSDKSGTAVNKQPRVDINKPTFKAAISELGNMTLLSVWRMLSRITAASGKYR